MVVVIVLYKLRPDEAAAWRTLQRACIVDGGQKTGLRVLLYDNSPTKLACADLPDYASYYADPGNGGLSAAYNYALRIAEAERCEWLLTLDQDTSVPADFLRRLSDYRLHLAQNAEVAAIVPQLTDRGVLLSPRRVLFGRTRAIPSGFVGIPRGEIHAFNSGTLWRASSLLRIGGFSENFRLDYLDIWVYHQLHKIGQRTYVAGDIRLEHCLSLLDYKNRMSVERYQGFLKAESAFCDLHKGPMENIVLTLRLFARFLRQKNRKLDPAIQALTFRSFKDRIIVSRGTRVDLWKKISQSGRAAARTGSALAVAERQDRISVCLASFNGERFIEAQLRSILAQLSETDEVVVVDDSSLDSTLECIRSMHDWRIKLISSKSNRGVLAAFEAAIRVASGAVIFLSDQDDIWASEKISIVMGAFEEGPEVEIVVSDAALIDENGTLLAPSYFAQRGGFKPGVLSNFLHCSYLGCTMAFRRRICEKILPFPLGKDVMHDLWLGTANAIAGGKVIYIDSPLVLYRRHEGNATGNRSLSLARKIRIRWDLFWALVKAWPRLRSLPRG